MDYLSLISQFEVENKAKELFGLSTSDINVYLKVEAGKAGVRLLAKPDQPFPFLTRDGAKMPPVLAVLEVVTDSSLCWNRRLEMEVREYAGSIAIELLIRSMNLKLLVDKVINGPQIPPLVKSKALKALDPILAERKAKAAGIYQGHIGYEVDRLPTLFEDVMKRGKESEYGQEWRIEAGLWFVHAEYDSYDLQYGIASGILDLDDLSNVYMKKGIGLDSLELPEIVRIYAGMRAVDIACKGTEFDHLASEDQREGTLGSVAEEMTDAERVPPTVARAAISRIEEKLAKVRDGIRGKIIESAVVEVKPPRNSGGPKPADPKKQKT